MLNVKPTSNKIDLLIILSGPEPQRTILEKIITEQTSKLNVRATFVLGKPEEDSNFQIKNIHYISHADDVRLAGLIHSADVIVSRPGYSTIMDLSVFGKKAIFIPTPGQTEQEYLAETMKAKGFCFAEKQKAFNLESALEASKKFSGLPKMNPNDKIAITLKNLLQKI
jgi:uncharacterized protein (TIGR00661 family)